jgi:hypothetical protein
LKSSGRFFVRRNDEKGKKGALGGKIKGKRKGKEEFSSDFVKGRREIVDEGKEEFYARRNFAILSWNRVLAPIIE